MPFPLNLDQLAIFATIVDEGGFAAAARRLGRGQSVVTYAVQELEADLRVALFDRSAYRPVLSEAGRALLPRARRVLREAAALQSQADGIAGGLEASLALVVDAMFPMEALTTPLLAFQAAFPLVRTHLQVRSLGEAADMVADGEVDLGLVIPLFAPLDRLEHRPAGVVELVPVCASTHPLARYQADSGRPITAEVAEPHSQLVLADRSPRTHDQEHGVIAANTWRLADLGAKHAMLRAGLGWGSLPRHMAAADLAAGRLVALRFDGWAGSGRAPRLDMVVAHRADRVLGLAGRRLYTSLQQRDDPADIDAHAEPPDPRQGP